MEPLCGTSFLSGGQHGGEALQVNTTWRGVEEAVFPTGHRCDARSSEAAVLRRVHCPGLQQHTQGSGFLARYFGHRAGRCSHGTSHAHGGRGTTGAVGRRRQLPLLGWTALMASAALLLPGPAWLPWRAGFLGRPLRPQATTVHAVEEQGTGASGGGRVVNIITERSKLVDLPGATVASMDELMREEAVKVLAAGAERTEQVKGGRNLWHAYMKPTKMGPWTNQVRLTCQLRLAPSGSVHVDVVSFDVGTIDKDTGEMVFTSFEEDTFSLQWENQVTWRQFGDGLRLIHSSSGRMRMALPWWFPLPDAVVRATANSGVQLMLSDGQSKVAAAIKARHEARSAQRASTR